jgi:hypothetical protein
LVVTGVVGAIASVVWAAQAPPHALAPAPAAPQLVGLRALYGPPAAVQAMPPPPAANNANNASTPASAPVQPGPSVATPGFSVAQQVGSGGVPGTHSFTEGFGTTSPFGGTQMNQPGQPPFTEGFYGNQGVGSSMSQAGQPDFYDGFGFNRGVVPPNQRAQPMTPYPNDTTPPPSPNAGLANGQAHAQPLVPQSVGFYNGFGGGQPDFGFYAGFTTPR